MRKTRMKLTALALLFCCGLSATTWYVNGTAGGGGDGRSWGSAFKSVQKALDIAVSGDKIWIAGGVYHPENVREIEGENAYASSFELKDGVSLYGGFAGTETALAQRGYATDAIYAWEFASPTILSQHEGVIGGVLKTGAEPLTTGIELDGLVIENGNALGSGHDGHGGGLQGAGRISIRNCLFRGNCARNGGGVYWNGAITMESTGLFDNELVEEGWSGYGGGAAIIGDGFSVTGVIACGNGRSMRGIQSGGGMYLSGNGVASHCTVVGNMARRNASGVWLDSAACLLNSIVWGNTGAQTQLVADDGDVRYTAVESTSAEGVGNLPLLTQNAGPNGIDANDNWVDGYYPCFANPEERDFRLGAGSYAINRGDGHGNGMDACGQPLALNYPADLGACGSTAKGNLAIDFSAEYPYLYGGESTLLVYLGLSSPSMVNSILSADAQTASLSEVELHVWKAEWLKKGNVDITLTVEARGAEQSYWNVATVTRRLSVMPRPLVLAADDINYHFNSGEPELTWFIAAGRLIGDDRITGNLQCDLASGQIGELLPITRGTLVVEDGNNGENYSLLFQDGELTYMKGETAIQLAISEVEYNGEPQAPEIVTEPDGLDVTVTYTGVNGTDYGPSEEPPADAGDYEVHIVVDDEQYGGESTLPFSIKRAPLEAVADNKTRIYLEANPPLTISYNGFKGDDTAADITVPTATTEATQASPVKPDGYPIVLEGGNARNYDLTLVNGLLTITKAAPVIDENPSIAAITYGDHLGQATITPAGGMTPGTYTWLAPDSLPDAGEGTFAWTFVPEDGDNFAEATGTSTIIVAKRPVSVTAGSYNRQYGDDDPAFSASLTDDSLPLVGNDSITATFHRDGGDAVGTYDILMETVVISDNYAITSVPGKLTITPRAITITANSITKLLGQEDPELTWRITSGSLVHDDTVSGNLVRETGQTPGTYAIQQGTLSLSDNYTLTFQEGVFIISQVVLKEDDAVVTTGTITYGQHLADASIEGTVIHPATGEEVPGTFTWDTPDLAPGAGITEGRWTFTPDAQTGLNSFSGTTPVTVAKALLDVSLADDSPSRQYFCANPEFTLVYSGFVGNDTAASLRLAPSATTTAVLTSVPGEYPVTIGGGLDDNYAFRATGGTLTVTAATPSQLGDVSATPIVYGQSFMDSTLAGYFVQPESLAQIPGRLEWKTQDSSSPACGTYTREWTFTPASPYFNSISGTVTVIVEKATLTITADNFEVMLNSPLPTFTMSFNGLRPGDDPTDTAVITEMPAISCDAADTSEEGIFAIRLSGGKAPNYDIVLVDGTLTVNLPQPYVHNMSVVHVTYGEVLGETEVFDRPKLDYDYDCNIPFVYITDALVMYNRYDGQQSIPDAPGPYKPEFAFFTHPVTGEYITGVMSWEYGDVLLPAGSYDDFVWTFTPHEGQGVSAISGMAKVIVDPRPVRVTGPEVTVMVGEPISSEILREWQYRRDDVLEEPVCSGILQISRTNLQNPTAGVYIYYTYAISLGHNYKAVIDMEGPKLTVQPDIVVLTPKSAFIFAGDAEPDYLDYTLSVSKGIVTDRIEMDFTREPGTAKGKYRYHVTRLEYTLMPGLVVLNKKKAAFLYITDTYENVAVDSYDIEYGESLPTPTYTLEYVDSRDIRGTPTIQGNPVQPGTYTISSRSLTYTGWGDAPTFFDGTLTIKKRQIVLRTGTLYKQAGENDPVPELEVVSGSFLSGDSIPGLPDREAGEATGSYAFIPSQAMRNDPHYEYSFTDDSKLVITGAEDVQWEASDLAASSLIYGEPLSSSTPSGIMRDAATGQEISGTWSWVSPDDIVKEDGSRHLASFLPDNPLLTPPEPISIEVTLKPRHIGIRIHSHTIEWGDALPELTFDIVDGGLLDGDHFVGQLTAYKVNDWLYYIRLGSLTVSSGVYDISSVNTADEVPAVYVTKRRITVEALNMAKPAGSADPDGLYRITAGTLAAGDSVTDIRFSREEGEAPGEYTIAIDELSTALSPDMALYDVTLVDGTLSVLGDQADAPSGQRSKVIVNAEWNSGFDIGDTVVWESEEFIYGINAFSDLDYAIANADDNGVIFIAPGEYAAPNGVWNIERPLSLIGDEHGSEEGQIVLLGTIRTVGAAVQKLLLSNIAIASASDSLPALALGDGVGASFILDCQLIGGTSAVSVGMHTMGASFIYNDIEATGDCIRCIPFGNQTPAVPLTLVCNSFTGEAAISTHGFPVISSSNIFNNISSPSIGN